MKRWSIAWMVMMGWAHTAAAQAPGQTEPPSGPFLEKRVPEELAVEGVVLSRRNLGLQIEQLGDKWLVSLVDLTTGRVAASTKVDTLPPDREAAVASITHVVADLAAQIVGRTEPPPAPTPVAPTPQPGLIDDRAERAEREVAELKFNRQSIRFGKTYLVSERTATVSTVSNSRNWAAFQGELDQQLEPEEFYRQVGRPDLIEPYRRRRKHMIGGFVVSGIGVAAFTVLLARGVFGDSCTDSANFDACVDDKVNGGMAPLLITFGVGFAGAVYGGYYLRHQQPITENEAKALADAYNQKLRGQLGLPVVARRPILRDLRLTPYVTGREGGLVLGARF